MSDELEKCPFCGGYFTNPCDSAPSDTCEQALNALAAPQAPAGEPVAWRHEKIATSIIDHATKLRRDECAVDYYSIPLYAHPPAQVAPEGWRLVAAHTAPLLTEKDFVKCLVDSDCIGTVKMSYDTGPYEITRTSINADRLCRAVESAVRYALLGPLTVEGERAKFEAWWNTLHFDEPGDIHSMEWSSWKDSREDTWLGWLAAKGLK
jgi:hypothetical protein